jgi:hypothetical protein
MFAAGTRVPSCIVAAISLVDTETLTRAMPFTCGCPDSIRLFGTDANQQNFAHPTPTQRDTRRSTQFPEMQRLPDAQAAGGEHFSECGGKLG